jgi:hypothetical protein
MTTIDQARSITSRAALAEFIDQLRHNVVAHPEDVENATLENYLEALAAYLRDLPGFVRNNHWPESADEPSWALIAAVLAGAVVYE